RRHAVGGFEDPAFQGEIDSGRSPVSATISKVNNEIESRIAFAGKVDASDGHALVDAGQVSRRRFARIERPRAELYACGLPECDFWEGPAIFVSRRVSGPITEIVNLAPSHARVAFAFNAPALGWVDCVGESAGYIAASKGPSALKYSAAGEAGTSP